MSRNMEKVYRAALALNNIGVSLLSRHRYEAALNTFKDSISAIKLARRLQSFRPRDVGPRQDSMPNQDIYIENDLPHCVGDIDVKLQQAAERIAGSSSIATSLVSNDSHEMIRGPLNVDFVVLSDSEHISFQMHYSSQRAQQEQTNLDSGQENASSAVARMFLVRIDPIDHQTVEDRDMEVDISIMLYNCCVSCQVLVDRMPSNQFDRALHLRHCSRSLGLAAHNTIVMKLLEHARSGLNSSQNPAEFLPLLVQSLSCTPAVVSLLLFQANEGFGVTPASPFIGPATHNEDKETELDFCSDFNLLSPQKGTSAAPSA